MTASAGAELVGTATTCQAPSVRVMDRLASGTTLGANDCADRVNCSIGDSLSKALTNSGGAGVPASASSESAAVRTGGSFTGVTVTKNEWLVEWPPRSVAVTVIVDRPDWSARGTRLRSTFNS